MPDVCGFFLDPCSVSALPKRLAALLFEEFRFQARVTAWANCT